MGSSGSESVDFAVGSIVWVRRRNGSWWPGKILGPHDLSNNHLMSPRSGTPVKLLGREDASVDWYNLEKSKRVKAFRCGDFDECIEKAESSVGMASKKREKYARREDAILHALELEKQMLDNQVGKLDISSDGKTNKSSILGDKGSETSSGKQKADEHNTLEHLSEGICASPVRGNGFFQLNKMKEATMMPEGEAPPKMRDLQEFGLRTISSKRKYSSSTKADEFERPYNRFQAHTTSGGGYTIGRNNRANFLDDRKVSPDSLMEGTSGRGYSRCPAAALVPQNGADISSFRVDQAESHTNSLYVSAPDQNKDPYWAKRKKCMYLPTESNGYVGNINELSPTLKQVSHFPMSESKFHHHVSASDDNASEFSEDTESDSSDSDDSETDSDELNTVAGRGDEHAIEGSEAEGRLRHASNEELDDLTLASDIPSADDGVSKWKLKGKRNIRNTRNRSSHVPNAGVRMKNDRTYLETRGNTFNNRISRLSVNYQLSNDFGDYIEDDDSFDEDYWSARNTRHSVLRQMRRGRSNNNNFHIYDWNSAALEHRTPLNGYSIETEDYYANDQPYFSHSIAEGRRRNMLIEVDLKVQSNYPKQRLPIISLMSKLDGRAIIGHSLQIEEIAEGSSDALISKRRLHHEAEADYPLPSCWKTSRRTANHRVPRPDLSSPVDNNEDAEYIPRRRKSTPRDLYTGAASGTLVPSLNRAKKLLKKSSMSSGQKTRTLSSFSLHHCNQRIDQERHGEEAFALSELMKSECGGTKFFPCIPVNLVFSRLYEAVGRPPASLAPTNLETRLNTKVAGLQQQS